MKKTRNRKRKIKRKAEIICAHFISEGLKQKAMITRGSLKYPIYIVEDLRPGEWEVMLRRKSKQPFIINQSNFIKI